MREAHPQANDTSKPNGFEPQIVKSLAIDVGVLSACGPEAKLRVRAGLG